LPNGFIWRRSDAPEHKTNIELTMAGNYHFDIYVLKGTKWTFDQKFIQTLRLDAVMRAEALDSDPGNDGVRVIRVTTFGSTNRTPTETIEWISPGISKRATPANIEKRKKKPPAAEKPSQTKSSQAKGLSTTPSDVPHRRRIQLGKAKPPPKRAHPTKLIFKSIAVLLGAAATSWLLLMPITVGINHLIKSGLKLTPDLAAISVFSVAGLCFLVIVALAAKIAIRPDDMIAAFPKRYAPPPQPASAPSSTEATAQAPQQSTGKGKVPARFLPSEAAPDTADIFADMARDQIASLSEEVFAPPSESAESEKVYEATKSLSDDNRKTMLRFLERSLTELEDDVRRLDQYTVFGINLFLGGAIDKLSDTLALTDMQKFVLTREAVAALGTPSEMVDVFCARFAEYDKDRKYRLMTDMGRRVMDMHLADNAGGFRELPELMRRWRRSDTAAAQAQGIVVIMFTDLVGSTQMTHDRGDFGAQEIVRSHNAIVRTALAENHGEEVKHTGDGIMASFANPVGSVSAAIRIQQDLDKHNRDNPSNPVNVRIGLNAGDAVREEDDFFGQTVQLAARICDKADTGQIFITQSVRDLCQSHAFDMAETGPYALKGIDEPVVAYKVSSTP
jgi:adenylate cyclase